MLEFFTLVAAGIATGSIYALVGLGLVLIYKTQGILQFSQGEFFMVGAFVGLIAYTVLGFNYPLAFLSATLVAAVLGALAERILFRPLVDAPHFTLVMLTIGLSLMMKGGARIPYGGDIYVFPAPFSGPPINVLGVAVTRQSLAIIAISGITTILLHLLFHSTDLGKQMRATASNLIGARLVGVNIGRIHGMTWALASALGAGAGLLAGPITLLHPEMGSMGLLKGFAAAVLGGFTSAPGAIVGGLLMGVTEMLIGGYFSTQFMNVSAFLFIIFVLLAFPRGLFADREVTRV